MLTVRVGASAVSGPAYSRGVDEELEFDEQLRILLDQWERKLDIYTANMREVLEARGAVETAKHYVRLKTGGFGEAYEKLSPRQTLEGLVVEFPRLFDDDPEIVTLAQEKLDKRNRENE